MTLGELARLVDGEITGDPQTAIAGINGIREARRGDITFIANRRYAHLLADCQASAVVVGADVGASPIPAIRVKNPDLAFATIVEAFAPEPPDLARAIHPTAIVGRDACIGANVGIHAYSVVESGARVGDGTIIYPQVYIGHNAAIGANCLIYPQVVIRERCTVGDNCIIHSGTVIGSDGFGFSTVSGVHHKIPQIGIVEIGDDVEIGANVTIDRARFGRTKIGRGTKIDNLVQIAHNVEVGPHSLIIAQAGIAGSTRIGQNVILAGQSGVDGHRIIGDNVVVGAKAGVTHDIPSNVFVSGFPAHSHPKELKIQAIVRRLPELVEHVKALEEKLREIETASKDDGAKR
jgi:UDP-3-O-[3-hydroxymyristoyl] glucosamine N-acyltransferase